MINPQAVAQMLRLNQQDTNRLAEAWATAMNVANKVNSKGDALNALAKNCVSSDIVTKVNGYLNNPMAGFIAKAAGVDLNKVKNIVGDLQESGGTVQPDINQGQQPNDNLARLRAGLQQLKR